MLTPFYPKNEGRWRPLISLARMLPMYLVQQRFVLSDDGVEDVVYDSQAGRQFIGTDLNVDTTFDATSLLQLRHLLARHNLTKGMFETTNDHLT